MTDYIEEASRIAEEILSWRRAIHRRPELGNNEYETAALIEKVLGELGIRTERKLGTAVMGTLCGDLEGKTVVLRADMDALPLQEKTGCDFASEIPGVMHACGHDVHTAAVLGTAKILAAHRKELYGKVVFLFQPDEEGSGGAARLIREGCLDGADAVFGAHVDPALAEGTAGVKYGKFYAASDMFEIDVTGKSAHGARREEGRDALLAAARLTTELIELPDRVTDEKCVITVGMLRSGTARNIMPGEASLEGIIRTLGLDTRAAVKERFLETVGRISDETGTEASVRIIESYPGVVNDDGMTEFVYSAASSLLGDDNVCVIEEPTMNTEDFGYYLEQVPGTFYHVGAGTEMPLHNNRFLPSDKAVLTAAALHAAVVMEYLCSAK